MFYSIESSPYMKTLLGPTPFEHSTLATTMRDKLAKPILSSGDIHHGDIAPVIALGKTGNPCIFPMVWGVSIPNTPKVVPMMSLTTAERLFPESVETHRCLAVSSFYYERREADGKLFAVQPSGKDFCLMGAIYIVVDGFPHFVVLTRQPSDSIKGLTEKSMPVIFSEASAEKWLDPSEKAFRVARRASERMVYVRTEGLGPRTYA